MSKNDKTEWVRVELEPKPEINDQTLYSIATNEFQILKSDVEILSSESFDHPSIPETYKELISIKSVKDVICRRLILDLFKLVNTPIEAQAEVFDELFVKKERNFGLDLNEYLWYFGIEQETWDDFTLYSERPSSNALTKIEEIILSYVNKYFFQLIDYIFDCMPRVDYRDVIAEPVVERITTHDKKWIFNLYSKEELEDKGLSLRDFILTTFNDERFQQSWNAYAGKIYRSY